MARVMSRRECEIATRIGDGEALKHDGGRYVIGGLVAGTHDEIERMAKRGFVVIEQVGASRFARLAAQRASKEGLTDV